VLIVTDGVFSDDGDIADVTAMVSLCTDEDIMIVVDDAHGIGVIGHGRGTAVHAGFDPSCMITTGSFRTPLGGFGRPSLGRHGRSTSTAPGATATSSRLRYRHPRPQPHWPPSN
jgi:7-keto-8-aminopelargonate synthetase-like enzyme